jgi:sugar lactone lactonase YvrE
VKRLRATRCAIVLALALLVPQPARASAGEISTYAGGGVGDHGLAINASVPDPKDVTVDAAGNIFLAEVGMVRKVTPGGIITTVVGRRGNYQYDPLCSVPIPDGPVGEARFSDQIDVAVAPDGAVYVSELYQCRVRKIDSSGMIRTVVGLGSETADGIPATQARIGPTAIATDSAGTLFIADRATARIRAVDASGTITTVAGGGQSGALGDGGPATDATLKLPADIALDDAGNLLIADLEDHRVRKVDTVGIISTIAGTGAAGTDGDGGPATLARINRPVGVAADAAGNVYIAERFGSRIRKVAPDHTISTFAGGGTGGDDMPATETLMDTPGGLAAHPDGRILVAHEGGNRVRAVGTDGIIRAVAGNGTHYFAGDGGRAVDAQFNLAAGLAFGPDGNLYIADTDNNRVRKVDAATGVITTVVGNGIEYAGPGRECAMKRRQATERYGCFGGDGGPAADASLHMPGGIEFDAAGNLYIADTWNQRVRKVGTDGIITTIAGNGVSGFTGDGDPATDAALNFPTDVALSDDGTIYVVDTDNHRIRKLDATGTITTLAGGGPRLDPVVLDRIPATTASLSFPLGALADTDGNIYIADGGHGRVRKVSPDGMITTVAGGLRPGGLSQTPERPVDLGVGDGGPATLAVVGPIGLDFDAAGNLIIADTTGRVRRVDHEGTITTIAGRGCGGPGGLGNYGDGGPALNAYFCPQDLAVDRATGDIYVIDYYAERVRRIEGP